MFLNYALMIRQDYDITSSLRRRALHQYNEFMQLWNKARAACQEDFLHERFYTTDKPTKSLFNFVEGADSSLVYLAFKAGLVDNIYPSNNLLELKEFPRQIQESIKHFRKKFGLPFLMNTLEAKGTTKKAYCRHAIQLFEEHSCIYCINESKDKEAEPSTSPTMAVPTTEDESLTD
nr:hypothetical protein [Tanacetum cinerariifolium]